MRKISRLSDNDTNLKAMRGMYTHTYVAPEHDTARAPAAGRAGRRSKHEARARSQSKRLKSEAGAGAIKARALCTVSRDNV